VKTLKVLLLILSALIFMLTPISNAQVTVKTGKYVQYKAGGVTYLRFSSYGMLVAGDTLYLPFGVDKRGAAQPCDSAMVNITVSTAKRSATDSVALAFRYESSTDNSTWANTTTIGTDKTTWTTTSVLPTLSTKATQIIGINQDGGWLPFMRLMVVGMTGNDSAYVRVDVR